jgi:hypothetical protein
MMLRSYYYFFVKIFLHKFQQITDFEGVPIALPDANRNRSQSASHL